MRPTALRLGVNMGIFDTVVAGSDGQAATAEQLATPTKADPSRAHQSQDRIARLLASIGLLKETGVQTYTGTELSPYYVSSSPLAAFVTHMTSQHEILAQLPSYFEANGYQNPSDAFNGLFQYARRTDLHCFDWLSQHPKYQLAFNIAMDGFHKERAQEWFDYFPVAEQLRVEDSTRPLIVDVGGGLGQELIKFQDAHQHVQGRLILEDLPSVLNDIKDLPEGIETAGQDFFQPQHVKGAKSYYLRDVLHDWPNVQALKILGHIREAMVYDSVLLINENVLPEQGVSAYGAAAGMMMMSVFAAMDRTEKQFQQLIADAGMDLAAVWTPGVAANGSGTLFEVKLRS
ncbi:MAG: hypothetical protein M1828_006669 [Chrysothrix sp. TS-e1954]|nr:MAG: hypothetical protein M1828_006669 [Chrysothrix sp. TS-e1954]